MGLRDCQFEIGTNRKMRKEVKARDLGDKYSVPTNGWRPGGASIRDDANEPSPTPQRTQGTSARAADLIWVLAGWDNEEQPD